MQTTTSVRHISDQKEKKTPGRVDGSINRHNNFGKEKNLVTPATISSYKLKRIKQNCTEQTQSCCMFIWKIKNNDSLFMGWNDQKKKEKKKERKEKEKCNSFPA